MGEKYASVRVGTLLPGYKAEGELSMLIEKEYFPFLKLNDLFTKDMRTDLIQKQVDFLYFENQAIKLIYLQRVLTILKKANKPTDKVAPYLLNMTTEIIEIIYNTVASESKCSNLQTAIDCLIPYLSQDELSPLTVLKTVFDMKIDYAFKVPLMAVPAVFSMAKKQEIPEIEIPDLIKATLLSYIGLYSIIKGKSNQRDIINSSEIENHHEIAHKLVAEGKATQKVLDMIFHQNVKDSENVKLPPSKELGIQRDIVSLSLLFSSISLREDISLREAIKKIMTDHLGVYDFAIVKLLQDFITQK